MPAYLDGWGRFLVLRAVANGSIVWSLTRFQGAPIMEYRLEGSQGHSMYYAQTLGLRGSSSSRGTSYTTPPPVTQAQPQ